MGICMPTTLFGENDNNKEIFMNDIKMIRIGITGGTGFLGNRLVELLSKKNTPITCLTRGSSNIEAIKDKGAIEGVHRKVFLRKILDETKE